MADGYDSQHFLKLCISALGVFGKSPHHDKCSSVNSVLRSTRLRQSVRVAEFKTFCPCGFTTDSRLTPPLSNHPANHLPSPAKPRDGMHLNLSGYPFWSLPRPFRLFNMSDIRFIGLYRCIWKIEHCVQKSITPVFCSQTKSYYSHIKQMVMNYGTKRVFNLTGARNLPWVLGAITTKT